MLNNFRIKKETWLLLLLSIPFAFLAGRSFLSDNLKVYDAPGHVGAVWYIKEYLWPAFSGWNPLNLLGFDQGLLYPVLFHYLSASLAFIFGVETSIKLILVLVFLAIPLSTYFLVSQIFGKKKERFFVASFILLALIILPAYWGSDLKALTELGLLPSFASLPLLFFYIAFLPRLEKGKVLLPSFLLAAVILTHLVAGVVALVCLFSLTLVKFSSKQLTKYYFYHLLLSLLLTSFFWLPFLVNSSFLSVSVHLSSLGIENIISLFFAAILAFSFYKTKKTFLFTLAVSALILSLATTSDYLVERFFSGSFIYQKVYSLHPYRYQIYEYLFLIPLILYWPISFLFSLKKPKINPRLLVILPFLVLIFAIFFKTQNLFIKANVETKEIKNTGGRFLETFSREQSNPFIYTSQTNLVLKRQPWAYGLFTDANPNGPYLGSLIKSLNIDAATSKSGTFIEEKIVDRSRIPDLLNLFAIENFSYLDYSKEVSSSSMSFLTLKVSDQRLVEVPNQKIESISKNWDQAVKDWWNAKGRLTTLLINDPSGSLKVGKSVGVAVTIENHNKNWSNISIGVTGAKENVPILVKFSYFPGWQAYENGKKIQIYQVSPSLMLVAAKSEVTFVYQSLWYQNATLVISLLSLFIILAYETRKFTKKRK